MNQDGHTMLPGHTTAGLTYSIGARYILLGSGVATLLISVLIGTVVIVLTGVGVALTMVLLAAPAFNRRKLVYQVLLEAIANFRLRRKGGNLGSRTVNSLLYEDEAGRTKRLTTSTATVNFLPLDDRDEEYLTEIYTPANKLHTLMIVIDSWGDAVASSLDTVQAHAQAFSEILKSLSKTHGIGLKASLSFVKVPFDPNEAKDWLRSRMVEIEDGEDAPLRKLKTSFEHAINSAENTGGDFICFATISTYRPEGWSKLKPSQLPRDEIIKSKGYKLTAELISRLDSLGVHHVHRPDPYESALLLRGNLDIMNLPNLYRDAFVDKRSKGLQGFRTIEDSMVLAEGALPSEDELVARRTYLEVAGSTYSSVLFCPGFTRRRADPSYMQHVLQMPPELWGGLTLIYKTAPARAEEVRQTWNRWEQDSKSFRRRSRGSSARAREQDELSRIEEEDSALYHSDGDAVHLNLLATVNAQSPDELEVAIDALKNAYRPTNIPLREIKGDTQQWEARLATLGIPTGSS